MTPRQTQCARILALLQVSQGRYVSIPELMDLHIADYRRRIFELRQ